MTDDYIFLSYNGQQEEIKIPSNFQELKDLFFKAFNAETNKRYKFNYLSGDEEPIINEQNFSEAIKVIQEEEAPIFVVEDETEIEIEKDDLNNCININNQLDKPQIFLKRQNCIKNSMVLNNEQKDNESYVNSSINLYEEKKSNVNNSSNIYFKISNYANEKNHFLRRIKRARMK